MQDKHKGSDVLTPCDVHQGWNKRRGCLTKAPRPKKMAASHAGGAIPPESSGSSSECVTRSEMPFRGLRDRNAAQSVKQEDAYKHKTWQTNE